MSQDSAAQFFPTLWRARLTAGIVSVLFGAACTTFSPATPPEPDYYIDDYGMVHVPERDLSSGSYRLRPAYGGFSLGNDSRLGSPFYDPFYDSFYRHQTGFGNYPLRPYFGSRYGFYTGGPFGSAYIRGPVSTIPPATDAPRSGDAPAATGGIQRTPIASPVYILRTAPEPVLRPDRMATGERQPVDRGRPAYRGEPRTTRPARPAQRPRATRPAPTRPPPPKRKPRVIDP